MSTGNLILIACNMIKMLAHHHFFDELQVFFLSMILA